jgi:hypothetical protein
MMNDETEPFERHLSRQLTREIPTPWRAEILSVAQAADPQPSTLVPRPSLLSTLHHQFSTLFRPHPRAWAGLAAVWVVILALHLSSRDPTEVMARKTPPPSPEMLMVLRQQKLLLAELVERVEPRVADRPKAVLPPRPRSDRYRQSAMA